MSRRLFAWRAKPSEAEDGILARAAATHMLVVGELGPTQFIIKEADSSAKHKVQVGERQQCACNKSKSAPLCVHIAFVMLKVLRVPMGNPLLWQYGLIESEINDLLAQRYASRRARQAEPPSAATLAAAAAAATSADSDAKTQANGPPAVVRRPMKGDEDCPICQEPLLVNNNNSGSESPRPVASVAEGPLCWCTLGCGNSLHARCMLVWAQHRVSVKESITCPLCRNLWPDGTAMTLRTQISTWERKKKKREEAAAARQALIDHGIDPDAATSAVRTDAPPQHQLLHGGIIARAVGGTHAPMTLIKGHSNRHGGGQMHGSDTSNDGMGIAGVGIAGLTLAGSPTMAHAARIVSGTTAAASSSTNVVASNPYQTPLRIGSGGEVSPSTRQGGASTVGKLHSAVGAFRRVASSSTNDVPLITSSSTPTPTHRTSMSHGEASTPQPQQQQQRRPVRGSVVRTQIDQQQLMLGDDANDMASPMVPFGEIGDSKRSGAIIGGMDSDIVAQMPTHDRRRRTAPAVSAAFGRSVSSSSKHSGGESKYNDGDDRDDAHTMLDLAIGAQNQPSSNTPQPHIPPSLRSQHRVRHHRAPLASSSSSGVSAEIAPLIQPGHPIATEDRVARVAPTMGRLRLPPRHTSKHARAIGAAAAAAAAITAHDHDTKNDASSLLTINSQPSSAPSSSITTTQALRPSGVLIKGRQPLRSLGNGTTAGTL